LGTKIIRVRLPWRTESIIRALGAVGLPHSAAQVVLCAVAGGCAALFNLSLCMKTKYLIFCQICSPYQKHPPYSCSFNTTFTIQANPLASYTLAVALLPSLLEFVHFCFFPKACLIHDKVFASNLTLRV
jgi:hypothetical protein